MQRCPFSVERLGTISIVDSNVCVNMWETAYALPVWRRTHGGRSVTACDIPAQGLIGLIGYSYKQVTTSFPEAGLQRTPRLSVLGPEKFGDG
jgi:hypothetical protein